MSDLERLLAKEIATLNKLRAELPLQEIEAWEDEIASIETTLRLLKEQQEREAACRFLSASPFTMNMVSFPFKVLLVVPFKVLLRSRYYW